MKAADFSQPWFTPLIIPCFRNSMSNGKPGKRSQRKKHRGEERVGRKKNKAGPVQLAMIASPPQSKTRSVSFNSQKPGQRAREIEGEWRSREREREKEGEGWNRTQRDETQWVHILCSLTCCWWHADLIHYRFIWMWSQLLGSGVDELSAASLWRILRWLSL